MSTCIKNLFSLPVLIAVLGLIVAGEVTAQTFTNLHNFTITSDPYYTNDDGAGPYAGVISSGNTLYGAARNGGISDHGTIFKVNIDGTSFAILHSFTAAGAPYYTNGDGAYPEGRLILGGTNLYGVATTGGNSSDGTVFAVDTQGTVFTNLHNFTWDTDGANPSAGLVLASNTLYGTAQYGGSFGGGTVFKLNTDGTGFTVLHNFTGLSSPLYTNWDGANPIAGLTLSYNVLYGTALFGGDSGNGTIFRLNIDGTSFTTLHSLSAAPYYTNTDGVNPRASMAVSGNTLYGTASQGGKFNRGTVFKLNTNGTGFVTLHHFTDNGITFAVLTLSDNVLYGTSEGGSFSRGQIFKLLTDGTDFTTLYDFSTTISPDFANSDGAYPFDGVTFSDNALYGTASGGGDYGNGTIFGILLGAPTGPPPLLSIVASGLDVILTWPTNYSAFTLQSTTNLASPVWTTNLSAPVVVNGQLTVTNPISGTRQFFRLIQ